MIQKILNFQKNADALHERHYQEEDLLITYYYYLNAELTTVDQERALQLYYNLKILDTLEDAMIKKKDKKLKVSKLLESIINSIFFFYSMKDLFSVNKLKN